MGNNPRHPKISKSNVEAILQSLEDNHRNAQSQRTSNSGSHFIPSGEVDENGFPTGAGTIVGSGANGGSISPWVNDITPPGVPTGLTVFSESSIIFVTWDGTLQGGNPPDFDHISIYVDGVEKATFSNAGTYPTDSYEPDSVHAVTARAWDNAHAADGKPKPNGSTITDPISITVKSAVDVGQIEDAQNKAQEALDKIAGVSASVDKASQDAANAHSVASNAQSAADNASSVATVASGKADQAAIAANNAIDKADTALSRSVELVRNPSFDPSLGDLDGFDVTMSSSGAPSAPPLPYTTYGILNQRNYFSTWLFPLDRGRKYRFGAWVIADSADRPLMGVGWEYRDKDNQPHWDGAFKIEAKDALSWTWVNGVAEVPEQWLNKPDSMRAWITINARGADATGWWITGLTIRDVTESWNAQTTADGKNRIFASASEPSHDGLEKGDLWMQLNSDSHVSGIQVWNGSSFQDYVLMAKQVLVAGSVGTINLEDGAITADKVTASEALLEKLLVRKVKADEIDVGSLSAAIVQSGRFVTSDGLTGFDETGFWVKNKDGGYDFSASNDGIKMTGTLQTGPDNASHFQIKNTSFDTQSGEKRSTGVLEFYSYRDPLHPIGALTGWDTGTVSQLILGGNLGDTTYQTGEISVGQTFSSDSSSTDVNILSDYNEIQSTTLNNNSRAVFVVQSDTENQKSKISMSSDILSVVSEPFINDIPAGFDNYDISQYITWKPGYEDYNHSTRLYKRAGIVFLELSIKIKNGIIEPNKTIPVVTLANNIRPDHSLDILAYGTSYAVGRYHVFGPNESRPQGTISIGTKDTTANFFFAQMFWDQSTTE